MSIYKMEARVLKLENDLKALLDELNSRKVLNQKIQEELASTKAANVSLQAEMDEVRGEMATWKQQQIQGTVGEIPEFVHHGPETWDDYIQRVEYFFEANVISPDRKKGLLIANFGQQNFKRLRQLCVLPEKIADLTYERVCELMSGFCDPVQNKWVKRDEFVNRKQTEKESVSEYIVDLCGISEFCEWENYDQAMLQQLMSGMRDIDMKRMILRIKQPTFETARTYVLEEENSRRYARQLQTHTPESTGETVETDAMVCKISAHQKQQSRGPQQQQQHAARVPCHRCEGQHAPDQCWHRNSTCYFCGLKGHIEIACLKKRSQGRAADRHASYAPQRYEQQQQPPLREQHESARGRRGGRNCSHFMTAEAEPGAHSLLFGPPAARRESNSDYTKGDDLMFKFF